MRRLLKPVRDALAGLRARRGAPAFEADYGDARLCALVGTSVAAGRAPGLASARDAWRSGDRTAAIERLVAHFQTRKAPRFFADPAVLLARAKPPLGEWIDAAARYARQITDRGVPIYCRVAPPLRPGFPWQDAVGGADADLLFAVQVHRFQFLPRLALAAATGAYQPSDLSALLDDWMAFAPGRPDLAFCSNLVVIQRLVATTWACAFISAARPAERVEPSIRLLRVLAQDIAFLTPRFGDSYPNNHLLADRFAAWYVALLLPELMPAAANLDALDAEWRGELARQTYDDGGSIEHSAHYHGMAANMAAAYVVLSDANRRPVPDDVRERIGKILRVQAALSGADGHATDIGDSSDDPLFPLDGAPASDASMREVYRALFAPSAVPLAADQPARERAYWLLGGALAPPPVRAPVGTMLELPHGGLAVFADDSDTTRCVFRTGPAADTRYLPGHMHDDSLTVTLTRRGVPLIVDAGSYTYRNRDAAAEADGVSWRAYFTGPRAHNGLVVGDRAPFGVLRGDFRPQHQQLPEVRHAARASGAALAFLEAERASGPHCPRWFRGVVHLRGAAFIVYDIVERDGIDDAACFAFQWAPGCDVRAIGPNAAVARRNGIAARLAWSAGLGAADIVSGRNQPPNGWVSPGYGERVAAPQLIVPLTVVGALTSFAIDGDDTGQPLSLQCERPTNDTRAFRLERDSGIDVVLINAGTRHETIAAFGCTFEGRIAWMSVPRSGDPVVCWMDGVAFESTSFRVHHRLPALVAEYVR